MRIVIRVENKADNGAWVFEDKMADYAQILNHYDRNYLNIMVRQMVDHVMNETMQLNSELRKDSQK